MKIVLRTNARSSGVYVRWHASVTALSGGRRKIFGSIDNVILMKFSGEEKKLLGVRIEIFLFSVIVFGIFQSEIIFSYQLRQNLAYAIPVRRGDCHTSLFIALRALCNIIYNADMNQ